MTSSHSNKDVGNKINLKTDDSKGMIIIYDREEIVGRGYEIILAGSGGGMKKIDYHKEGVWNFGGYQREKNHDRFLMKLKTITCVQ